MVNWDTTDDGMIFRENVLVACQYGIIRPLTPADADYALGLIGEWHQKQLELMTPPRIEGLREKAIAELLEENARNREAQLRRDLVTAPDWNKASNDTIRATVVGAIMNNDPDMEHEDVACLADEIMHALARLGVIDEYGDTRPAKTETENPIPERPPEDNADGEGEYCAPQYAAGSNKVGTVQLGARKSTAGSNGG